MRVFVILSLLVCCAMAGHGGSGKKSGKASRYMGKKIDMMLEKLRWKLKKMSGMMQEQLYKTDEDVDRLQAQFELMLLPQWKRADQCLEMCQNSPGKCVAGNFSKQSDSDCRTCVLECLTCLNADDDLDRHVWKMKPMLMVMAMGKTKMDLLSSDDAGAEVWAEYMAKSVRPSKKYSDEMSEDESDPEPEMKENSPLDQMQNNMMKEFVMAAHGMKEKLRANLNSFSSDWNLNCESFMENFEKKFPEPASKKEFLQKFLGKSDMGMEMDMELNGDEEV